MTLSTKHISVTANYPSDKAYAYISQSENLPKWASGLSESVKIVNGELHAESPMGSIKITFPERNYFGILDHEVSLASGEKFYNPMRVFPNQDGCEILFTLFRHEGVSDEAFLQDEKTILKDLNALREILENMKG